MKNPIRKIKEVEKLLTEATKLAATSEELKLAEDYSISDLVAILYPDEIEVINLGSDETEHQGERMAMLRFTQYPKHAIVIFAKDRHGANFYQLHLTLSGFTSRGYAVAFSPVPVIDKICQEKGIETLLIEFFQVQEWRKAYPALALMNVEAAASGVFRKVEKYFNISYIPD